MIAWLQAKATTGVVAILLIIAAYAFGYVRGGDKKAAECQAASLQSEIASLQRDIKNLGAAAADAEQRAGTLAGINDSLEQKVNEYVAKRRSSKANGCTFDDADVGRLCDIWGATPGGQPAACAGLRKAGQATPLPKPK